MKQPRPTRLHLTPDQQHKIIQHHHTNPTKSLAALCIWAGSQLELKKDPSPSSVSKLLTRWRNAGTSFTASQGEALLAKVSRVLDSKLMKWICTCERLGVCLTGHMIRYQAEVLRNAVVLDGVPALTREKLLLLKFSKGWLYNFQLRNKLVSRRLHGEAASVNEDDVVEGRKLIQEVTAKFEKRDVFNMDETAMYYCRAPSTTISPNPVSGKKKSKKRMTVAVTANADGTEKLPLLFVGSARQPRCFNKQSTEQLNVNYTNTKKGWMTRQLFRSWVLELNAKMKAENRNILLLLDNVSSHHFDEPLSNVKIQMLPPNTTSVLQPQDAGIIASLKAWIRRKQIEYAVNRLNEIMILTTDENAEQMKKQIANIYTVDILEAMRWCSEAWDSVTQTSIANCWKHTGILPDILAELMHGISGCTIAPII